MSRKEQHRRKGSQQHCIGFPRQGSCVNVAGTAWSPYYCADCDAKRRAYVDGQFQLIGEEFDRRQAERA